MPLLDEYRALRAGRRPRRPIDARAACCSRAPIGATYLQGLLTNDIAALAPGTGCYAAYLTAQGTDDRRHAGVRDRGQPARRSRRRRRARRCAIAGPSSSSARMSRFRTSPHPRPQIGVYGPRAAEVLEAALAAGPNCRASRRRRRSCFASMPSYAQQALGLSAAPRRSCCASDDVGRDGVRRRACRSNRQDGSRGVAARGGGGRRRSRRRRKRAASRRAGRSFTSTWTKTRFRSRPGSRIARSASRRAATSGRKSSSACCIAGMAASREGSSGIEFDPSARCAGARGSHPRRRRAMSARSRAPCSRRRSAVRSRLATCTATSCSREQRSTSAAAQPSVTALPFVTRNARSHLRASRLRAGRHATGSWAFFSCSSCS